MKVPCCRTCRNYSPDTRRGLIGRCSLWSFGFYHDIITNHPEKGPDIFACGNHQDWEAFREIAAEVESLRKAQLPPEAVVCILRYSFCGTPWKADEHAICTTCKNLWSESRYAPVEVKA